MSDLSPKQLNVTELEDVQSRASMINGLVCFVLYLMVCGIHLSPNVAKTDIKAFGEAPFGIHVLFVIIAVQTIFFLPVPYFGYHFALLQSLSLAQGWGGTTRGIISFFFFLYSAYRNCPQYRASVFLSLGGMLYCVAMMILFGVVYAIRSSS